MDLHDETARRDGIYPNVISGFHQRATRGRVLHFSAPEKWRRTSRPLSNHPKGRSSKTGHGRRETILLVDEDEGLRDLEKTVLASNGYNVLTAKDGEQAMRMFSRYRSDISLVFADIALPKLRGDRLLQKMRKIDPQVRVIFAGGYVDAQVRSELLDAGAMECIQKPGSAGDIMAMIQGALNHH